MEKVGFTGTAALILLLIFPNNAFSQDSSMNFPGGSVPEILRRPAWGEAPRFPRDMVIGELGQGTAPYGAWTLANAFLSALLVRNPNNPAFSTVDANVTERSFAALNSINPFRYHIGGGRIEPDGTVSFLVRFLGREQWIAAELYLQLNGNDWTLDDFILEEARNLEDAVNPYPHNFTPYERFF